MAAVGKGISPPANLFSLAPQLRGIDLGRTNAYDCPVLRKELPQLLLAGVPKNLVAGPFTRDTLNVKVCADRAVPLGCCDCLG